MTAFAGEYEKGSRTLVDNWRYDPAAAEWTRLADLPVASGNFQTNGPMTAFQDRYIILIGMKHHGMLSELHVPAPPSFCQDRLGRYIRKERLKQGRFGLQAGISTKKRWNSAAAAKKTARCVSYPHSACRGACARSTLPPGKESAASSSARSICLTPPIWTAIRPVPTGHASMTMMCLCSTLVRNDLAELRARQ